jgi:hypothetical protein
MHIGITLMMGFDYNAAEYKKIIILLTFSGVITD